MECWNAFCIAGECDGTHHYDVTGYSWTQPRDTIYCAACHDYHAPGDCPEGYVSPVVTIYERISDDDDPDPIDLQDAARGHMTPGDGSDADYSR